MSKTLLPADFKVICSVCGDSLEAAKHFAPGQIQKKHPRCRACAPNKHGNQPTGGHQSKRENSFIKELRVLADVGLITDFREQIPFVLIPTQRDAAGKVIERSCVYIADASYTDDRAARHIIDVKGMRTAVYRIKRKLMLSVHHIRIEEG